MIKIDILKKLEQSGVVAVVRGSSKDVGVKISESCIRGNIGAIEITYTNKFASEIIKELVEKYSSDNKVVIGAGTVLDSETARIAILAGASFIVSPSFNLETARICNRYSIPYIPGVITITEIVTAYESGVDIVKVFPGNIVGQGYINSIKGPLPQATVMVTGGVNLENINLWIKAGANLVGIGSELNKLGEAGEFKKIEDMCNEYIERYNRARKA